MTTTWSRAFPAASPPEGLRHIEVNIERREDRTPVPCRIYEWQIQVAEWYEGRWQLMAGQCKCAVPLDGSPLVYAFVSGDWTTSLGARAWDRYALRWAPFNPPEGAP